MNAPKGDSIVAVSTPPGRAIRAIVRISGPDAFYVCSLLSKSFPIQIQPYSVFRTFLDIPVLPKLHVSFVFFQAPRSYTGEDLVEISLPGSNVIRDELLAFLLSSGCRLAGPGEFTRRAFENGRINLSQAQAVLDLIHSSDEAARNSSLTILTGGLDSEITGIRCSLLDILSRVEANLDFAGEDIQIISPLETIESVSSTLRSIESLLSLSRRINTDLPRVVITGHPNSGKTTLFNALGSSSALVSEFPGTTTDPIKVEMEYGGNRFTLWDTPGTCDSNRGALLSAEEISKPLIAGASLVLSLSSVEMDSEDSPPAANENFTRCIRVITKCDLSSISDQGATMPNSPGISLRISALTGEGIRTLLERITSLLADTDSEISLGDWQYEALTGAMNDLHQVSEIYAAELPDEIAAIPIRSAISYLEIFEGKDASEEVLDRIFAAFCIGK